MDQDVDNIVVHSVTPLSDEGILSQMRELARGPVPIGERVFYPLIVAHSIVTRMSWFIAEAIRRGYLERVEVEYTNPPIDGKPPIIEKISMFQALQ